MNEEKEKAEEQEELLNKAVDPPYDASSRPKKNSHGRADQPTDQ